MRDDEDNIRQYLPVLRRIIILVAVLTAIPVVMWTITVFVRNHVSPPHAPALQPMASVPSGTPANTTVAAASDQPPQSPTQSVNTAEIAPSGAPANAGTNDAATAAPAFADATPTGATPAFRPASVGAPSSAAPDDATPAAPGSPAAAAPTDSGAPNQSPDNDTQASAHPQDSAWPAPTSADALPPGEPLSGPVPLPRKRPASFAMAGNVPLPEPRPDAAGGAAPKSTPTPIDWLKKVFHHRHLLSRPTLPAILPTSERWRAACCSETSEVIIPTPHRSRSAPGGSPPHATRGGSPRHGRGRAFRP